MKIDEFGLPKIEGSSDAMDSAFFAGILSMFNYPEFDPKICLKYYTAEGLVRHPFEVPANNPKNFSRDQLVPLMGGIAKISKIHCITILAECKHNGWFAPNTEEDHVGTTKTFPRMADWLSPSVRGYMYICVGDRPSLLSKINLFFDIVWASYFDRKHEVNQLLCMCLYYGPFWMRLLKRLKKDLNENILSYWGSWRGEMDFGNHIVNYIARI